MTKLTPEGAAFAEYWKQIQETGEAKDWNAIARAAVEARIAQLGPGEMLYNPDAGPLFPEDEGE